jgi:hypothetical protein
MICVKHVSGVLGYDAVKIVTHAAALGDLSIPLFRKKKNTLKNKGINLLRNVGIYMPVYTASLMLYVKFKHICTDTTRSATFIALLYRSKQRWQYFMHVNCPYVNFKVSYCSRN